MKKSAVKQNYNGMTVKERLFASGLLERFRVAAHRRNRRGMITMLKRLAVSENYAAQWVDAVLTENTQLPNHPSTRN